MSKPARYAFYGSLRKEMPLYQQFEAALSYQFSTWLEGYALYSLGPYPCAVKSESGDRIWVEVMDVTDEKIKEKIDFIEQEAGYEVETIWMNEEEVSIFIFSDAANYPKVEGGDWVKFFGK